MKQEKCYVCDHWFYIIHLNQVTVREYLPLTNDFHYDFAYVCNACKYEEEDYDQDM